MNKIIKCFVYKEESSNITEKNLFILKILRTQYIVLKFCHSKINKNISNQINQNFNVLKLCEIIDKAKTNY